MQALAPALLPRASARRSRSAKAPARCQAVASPGLELNIGAYHRGSATTPVEAKSAAAVADTARQQPTT